MRDNLKGITKERDIVNAVKNYFEEKDALCIEEFWLPTDYPKQYKKPDLVIIPKWRTKNFKVKWEKDIPSLDATAIECKFIGTSDISILSALPQAIVYQQFFPKVCIACSGEENKQIRDFLERNGIGYIAVDGETVKERILPNEEANIFNPNFVKLNQEKIANKLVVLALGRWKFGDVIQIKGEHYGDFNVSSTTYGKGWVTTYPCRNNKAIQWSIITGYDFIEDPSYVYSGLNIEKPKKDYEKIFRRITVKDFLRLIKDLPEEYSCIYYKKERRKGQMNMKTLTIKKATQLTEEDIVKVKKYMTDKYGGYLGLFKMIWKKGFTENDSKRKLDEVERELGGLFEYLGKL
jgi:hypothetical protein